MLVDYRGVTPGDAFTCCQGEVDDEAYRGGYGDERVKYSFGLLLSVSR